ncbi:OmpA family protein [Hydrogenophaga sp.]|uniref:OmpA family protein n=1 Tax=Hydrogenophaga sp. TaxID=1904254 RepID=UPI00260C410D|nr:OmpA family protein [Hydrogenophaga sp.]MDM7948841.1 OmpA family protein [Hydrogenophaga sp.]
MKDTTAANSFAGHLVSRPHPDPMPPLMRKTFALPLLLSALAITGCAGFSQPAPAPTAQATGLTPQAARITDERILGDRKTMETVQQRLRALNEAGVLQNNYSLAKAQCWLDTAKTQYHENDRTGYVEESLAESIKITQALEADKAARAGLDTPLVAGSVKLRDDLWAKLAGFKNNPATLSCNARTVACAEVRLVRAGHAQEQTGWRQATPHVAMAEDAVRRAADEAASCAVPAAAPGAGLAPAPAPAPAPVVVQKESIVLLGDALFKFNKAGRDDLLPGGLERLREVAESLKKYRSIETLDFIGHTDRYGRTAYNDALSLTRANTVRAYLEGLGVKAAKTTTEGRGSREPLVQCSTTPPKAQQVICLQPNRRVQIEVLGIK